MRDVARLQDNAAGTVPGGTANVGGTDVVRYYNAAAANGATHFVLRPQPQIPLHVAVDTRATVDPTYRAGSSMRFALPVGPDSMVQ